MLEAMRDLALDFLWSEEGQGEVPDNLNAWFKNMRAQKPEQVFPYLVEASENIEKYYTLSPDPDDADLAILEVADFQKGDNTRLPFNQASGPQSPALGPVIKRTYKSSGGTGPSPKIQASTLDNFEKLAREGKPWSAFFDVALQTFRRPKLLMRSEDKTFAEPGENAYSLSVKHISERQTVFLAFKDDRGKLPGEHLEYLQYLQEILARTKYTTKKIPPVEKGLCSLSSEDGVTVFPNALSGAGINIANVDRHGAFPGIIQENAALGYALSLNSADLLYIYKNCVSKLFMADIAGNRALIIPRTQISGRERQKFFKQVQELTQIKDRIENREERLMRLLGNEQAITSLDIIWAKFGQKIENLQGLITDILPSRLRKITEVNDQFNLEMSHPIFPEHKIYKFDLTLRSVSELLKRPGGNKAKSVNASHRLFQFKKNLASAIYHGNPFSRSQFWGEVFITAQWYLNKAIEEGNAWDLLNEGYSTKTQKPYWTFAGWIRHLAQFIYYLRKLEVFPMPQLSYRPDSELLKPYFGEKSGIDTDQKAFAFLVGVLYGKVMQVQGAKGVNVGSNALTWLKRLTLTGKDLPDFYCKVREKLLAYETEGNENVREVLREVGYLGTTIGDTFDIPQTTTCYFLLLGQSVAIQVLPSSNKDEE